MPLFLSIYVFGIIGFFIHLFKIPANRRTWPKTIELLLLYQIVFSLGLTSIMSFFGLTFMSEYVAAFTNWPASPFEQQLANVNLAFGTLGILSIWFRGLFWTATILGFSIWIIGDGIHHLLLAIFQHNYSEGNVGVPLYTDFIIPFILLFLLFLHTCYKPKTLNPLGENP